MKITRFLGMTKRNMLVYFKDKQTVFFSMLTPILILILYVLFLKDSYISMMESSLQGLENLYNIKDVNALANSILLSGVLGTGVITVAFNTLSVITEDKENKIDYDICASPVSRVEIILSYFMASFITTFIMTSIILTFGILVINISTPMNLGIINILKLYLITLLGSISSTSLLMIILIFFKTTSAQGAFYGIVSAVIGFIIGAYIPISQFDPAIQTIANLFPGSHIAALYRGALLDGPINSISNSLQGLDNGMFKEEITKAFSFNLNLFNNSMSSLNMILYVVLALIVSIVLICIIYPKVYKRK